MRGLLCFEGTREELLIFICGLCNKEHVILVSQKGPYVKGTLNVWGYSFVNKEHIRVFPNLFMNDAQFHPSIDLSEYCGKHSGVNWLVNVLIIPQGQYRTENTEAWLRASN